MFRRSLERGVGTSLPYRPQWWRKLRFVCEVAAWFCRRFYRLGRWSVRHWQTAGSVAAVGGLWWLWFRTDTLDDRRRVAALGLLILAGLVWVVLMPGGVAETRHPVRSWWRKHAIYRRDWQPVMLLAGLSHSGLLPRILRVTAEDHMDVVNVAMLPGQVPTDFKHQAERLAQGFGATSCEVLAVGGGSPLLVLEFERPGWRDLPADGQW